VFREDPLHLHITRKSPFSRRLQTSINAFKLISGRVIYTAAQFRIDFERDLRELALRLFWPIRDSLQCLLKGFCSHNNTHNASHVR
jgi:hypothetical protein